MRTGPGAHAAGAFFILTAGALVGLGSASLVRAQVRLLSTQPPPAAQPAKPAEPVDTPGPSQVFPDGGFPDTPPAPEGGIPAPAVRPGPGLPHPELQPPSTDYAPPGVYPREQQEGPGVPEFYEPYSDPLPEYYYRPAYYDTAGVGARPL